VTDSSRNAAVVPALRVSACDASRVDEATEPVALPEVDGAPQRQVDITAESAEPAADEESHHRFSQRIGSRKVLLALACVAAVLVGFGSMTVLLKLGDRPAQSDTKPALTTAAPVVPPSSAAPAVTTPPASAASGPAVENEPPPPGPESPPAPESVPPAPESVPPAPESVPPAPESVPAPNLNPAGKAPPGLNG
jgi:hypothetical protein